MINYLTIEIEGEDVPVEVHFDMVDFGIGVYEFWGCKGYDSHIGPEITDIILEKENGVHHKFIDDNYEDLCEKLYEKLEPDD